MRKLNFCAFAEGQSILKMDYIYYGLSVSPSIKTFKKNEFRIVRNIA
jgi:hypothetical protein